MARRVGPVAEEREVHHRIGALSLEAKMNAVSAAAAVSHPNASILGRKPARARRLNHGKGKRADCDHEKNLAPHQSKCRGRFPYARLPHVAPGEIEHDQSHGQD